MQKAQSSLGPLMIDLDGVALSEPEQKILIHPMVGGVILFTKNFKTVDQLKKLVADIRILNPKLLLAIDQEGGYVQRFQRRGFRAWPAARVYGDIYDKNPSIALALAYQYGQEMGEELASYEIDINFAPVIDLDTASDVIGKLNRAFHKDPNSVIKIADAFVKGLHNAGITAVVKHFPGHGICVDDSHITKPTSDATLDIIEPHLLPFRQMSMSETIKAMMPAHITYTQVDPLNIVGFSKKWLQEILRDQLKFTGAIISDCLTMEGADIGSLSERALAALNAGCDMVVMCWQSRAEIETVLDTLLTDYRPSDESVRRLLALKRHTHSDQDHALISQAVVKEVELSTMTVTPTSSVEVLASTKERKPINPYLDSDAPVGGPSTSK